MAWYLLRRAALIALAWLTVSGAALSADSLAPVDPRRCVNVAQNVGLDFSGAYGTTFPGDDSIEQAMQRNLGNGAAVGDYDGDGDLDVYLLGQGGHLSRLFRNELIHDGARGTPRFTDVTDAAGLGANRAMSRTALFVDLDRDGLLDLVVGNDYVPGLPGQPSAIYRNDGNGRFTDVTAGSGFNPTGYIVGGLAVVDEAARGLPSIYVSYWTADAGGDPLMPDRPTGRFPGQNRFYRNLGGFHFEDVTTEVGLAIRYDSFQAIFADFDSDRRPDLYLAIDHRADRYFRNVGGRFVDESRSAGVGNVGNDMGVAAGDLDADGRIDLYVSNITDPDQSFGTYPPGNTLLMGDGGPGQMHVTNVAREKGVRQGGWGWGASFVDVDMDGVLDIYTVQGFDEWVGNLGPSLRDDTARLYRGDGAGGFSPDPESGCEVPGDQRALIPFDFNRDGYPDLLITQVDKPTLLLENRTHSAHWMTVVLDPTAAAASGAWVTVRAAGRIERQLVLASSSYLSGLPLDAYVGLGTAAVADEVRVDWPDGRSLVLHDVAADQLLSVHPPP
jgi:hypothetical protein